MAGSHFSFLKRAGHHQKGAGCRALQKRPRQNTAVMFCSMWSLFNENMYPCNWSDGGIGWVRALRKSFSVSSQPWIMNDLLHNGVNAKLLNIL